MIMSKFRHCWSRSLTSKKPTCHPLASAITLVLGSAAHAATFTVLNTNDNGPDSLRQAVIDANMALGADNIVFDPALNNSTITLTTGQIDITDELTISGNGDADSIIIDGDNQTRVFIVNKSRTSRTEVTLENMTLTGGKHVPDTTLQAGGAIGILQSKVTLNNSVVIGNSDSGIYGYISDVILNNTLVTNNSGHGVFTSAGSITLNQSTASANSNNGISIIFGSGNGGTLNQSTVADNGGFGVNAVYSTLSLYQSTVSGNSGGGISGDENVSLEQTTVSDNNGIGVNIDGSNIILKQSTITDNRTGLRARTDLFNRYDRGQIQVTLENTILTNNTGSGGNFTGILDIDGATLTFNASSSLLGNDVTGINGINSSNIFSDSPGLGLLQDNGGLTQTHLPDISSPAVNAGNNATALFSFDQRGNGFPRIIDGTVDIGAVERQAPPPQPIPTLSLPALLSLIASFVALAGWLQTKE